MDKTFNEFFSENKAKIDEIGLEFSQYKGKGYYLTTVYDYGCGDKLYIQIKKTKINDSIDEMNKFLKQYEFPKRYYDYVCKIVNELNKNLK